MGSAVSRLRELKQALAKASEAAGRRPEEVTLLAVSKGHPARAIRELAGAGQGNFGESYLREALGKQAELADLPLAWHFIGPLQSNKTRDVARHFDWVHSVDREKLARRLNDQRPPELPPLNLCIQVNIDREAGKSGVAPEDTAALAARVAELPRLRLRGLMAIPRADAPDHNREAFRRLAMTVSQLRHTMPELDTLSMGMSNDFHTAIAEGATIVRLGTVLFGPRTDNHRGET